MKKLSEILLELSKKALAQPVEETTQGGGMASLFFAQLAWNRAIDRDSGPSQSDYLKILAQIELDYPEASKELKSRHYEGLIQMLVKVKLNQYPLDDRFIYGFGFTPEGNLQVQWDRRKIKV